MDERARPRCRRPRLRLERGAGALGRSNASLTSLEGLEGLTALGGAAVMVTDLVIRDNDALVSLAGLENLAPVGGRLLIRFNDALSACAPGLNALISCDPPAFIGVSGGAIIESNASGGQCNSPQAVLDAACTSVANEPSSGGPSRFALAAPRPNPFRYTATVGFAVPMASDVRLAVYDVLGREVAVLADGPFEAARHEAVFDGRGIPTGTYLVRMTTDGGFAETRRVTVVR